MRLYNAEIKLLLPIVRQQAKENPNREWDRLLERLEKLAKFRAHQLKPHLTQAELVGETNQETSTQAPGTPSRDHPLL